MLSAVPWPVRPVQPTSRRANFSESHATANARGSRRICFRRSTKHARTPSFASTTALSDDDEHELAKFASTYSLGSPLTRVKTRTESSCLWENLSESPEPDEHKQLYHDNFVSLTRTRLIITHLLFLTVSIPLSSIRSARPFVTEAEVVKLSTRPQRLRRAPHGVTTGGFGWTGTLWARDVRRMEDETWLRNAVVLEVAGWFGRIGVSVERPEEWWAAWACVRASRSA